MYEYAATAIGPKSSGASFDVRYMAVGPSAPPIIPIDPACLGKKSNPIAPIYVAKIPSCAAAPNNKLLGFAIRGPKSVKAPTPKKIKHG